MTEGDTPTHTRPRGAGLWRNRDFLHFWTADTISVFGSLVTRTAMPLTAILALDATAVQVALLSVADLLPALLVGLPVGVWVDRLRRRPILISADVGRALVLATVPLAALFDALTLGQLYVVAFLAGVMGMAFEVAHRSYLPALVTREQLVPANGSMSATRSVSEVGAFGASGWLVQALSGPGAIFIDAVSFLVSALFLGRIRTKEPPPERVEGAISLRGETAEGIRAILRDPVLLGLAGSSFTLEFSFSIFGTLISLYAIRELGFHPGPLGMIYGVGGLTSLIGAGLAATASRRLGTGRALIAGVVWGGIAMLALPFATNADVVGGALLVAQQFGDGGIALYLVLELSLLQAVAPPEVLGRINATTRSLNIGGRLVGTVLAGVLGATVGLRPTLALGGGIALAAVFWLLLTPVRRLQQPV